MGLLDCLGFYLLFIFILVEPPVNSQGLLLALCFGVISGSAGGLCITKDQIQAFYIQPMFSNPLNYFWLKALSLNPNTLHAP